MPATLGNIPCRSLVQKSEMLKIPESSPSSLLARGWHWLRWYHSLTPRAGIPKVGEKSFLSSVTFLVLPSEFRHFNLLQIGNYPRAVTGSTLSLQPTSAKSCSPASPEAGISSSTRNKSDRLSWRRCSDCVKRWDFSSAFHPEGWEEKPDVGGLSGKAGS